MVQFFAPQCRNIALSYGAKCVSISSCLGVDHEYDRQTDGQMDRSPLAIARYKDPR